MISFFVTLGVTVIFAVILSRLRTEAKNAAIVELEREDDRRLEKALRADRDARDRMREPGRLRDNDGHRRD